MMVARAFVQFLKVTGLNEKVTVAILGATTKCDGIAPEPPQK
jgi:hypothetical protein